MMDPLHPICLCHGRFSRLFESSHRLLSVLAYQSALTNQICYALAALSEVSVQSWMSD
jgi:hypothetical protein